jgi:hypothetical protein
MRKETAKEHRYKRNTTLISKEKTDRKIIYSRKKIQKKVLFFP